MDLSTLGGGGGWKQLALSSANFQNLPQGELLKVIPTSEQTVRLTMLAVASTSDTVANITVLMGLRKLIDKQTIHALYSTSALPNTNIGSGSSTVTTYIEGKKGEALTINSENVGGVGNKYLCAAYEIGMYE
jgi:hypothetical protein